MRVITPAQQHALDVAVEIGLLWGVAGSKRRRVVEDADLTDKYLACVDKLLTPAQQHADQMLEWLRRLESFDNSPALRELLDKLDPPGPPTLDEALALLRKLEEAQWSRQGALPPVFNEVRALLARVPGEQNA